MSLAELGIELKRDFRPHLRSLWNLSFMQFSPPRKPEYNQLGIMCAAFFNWMYEKPRYDIQNRDDDVLQ
jgi:hypothetical protein